MVPHVGQDDLDLGRVLLIQLVHVGLVDDEHAHQAAGPVVLEARLLCVCVCVSSARGGL